MIEPQIELLDFADRLTTVRCLVEAIYMAAADIADRKCTSAIQTVCMLTDEKIEELQRMVGSAEEIQP